MSSPTTDSKRNRALNPTRSFLWSVSAFAATQVAIAQPFDTSSVPTSREGPGAYAPPDARFEMAPKIGEPLPDISVVDRDGNPVNVREVASEHYTVLVLGCLT